MTIGSLPPDMLRGIFTFHPAPQAFRVCKAWQNMLSRVCLEAYRGSEVINPLTHRNAKTRRLSEYQMACRVIRIARDRLDRVAGRSPDISAETLESWILLKDRALCAFVEGFGIRAPHPESAQGVARLRRHLPQLAQLFAQSTCCQVAAIPEEVHNLLSNVTHLICEGHPGTPLFLGSLANIPNLNRLSLSGNLLTDREVSELFSRMGTLPGLTVLELNYNRLTTLPEELGRTFPRLQKLCLTGNQFTAAAEELRERFFPDRPEMEITLQAALCGARQRRLNRRHPQPNPPGFS